MGHQMFCMLAAVSFGPPYWSRLGSLDNYLTDALEFCIDIYSPQRMNPNDVGDPQTFPLHISHLCFLCETSQQL